ncbi:putative NUDIX hydrolase [Brazilian marseillevirus]|uniref:putative NUDIX hydrolase n=1 Tax=Brazilian marseillevirus TaxID=1813599 RepID=UPI0007806C70|nr:putative NUDIX hydrolase [Brazilian marseillevirus]AMQ10796.1 putative NUDIX hydrolase [Brazilian marseillevirus]
MSSFYRTLKSSSETFLYLTMSAISKPRITKVSHSTISEFAKNNGDVIRVGVVPFIRIGEREYWLLTQQPDGNYSDFGGGRKRTETLEEALLREVEEESSGLLTDVIRKALKNKRKISVLKANNGIHGNRGGFFLTLEIPFVDITKFKPNSEVGKIRWIEKNKVLNGTWSFVNRSIVQYTKFLYFEEKDKRQLRWRTRT